MTAPRPSGSSRPNDARRILTQLAVPSEPGNERRAMEVVAEVARGLGLEGQPLERIKTAVAEATMNAMEHGNGYRKESPVHIEVAASEGELSVRITDEGGGPLHPQAQTPDLEAKLEGLQNPRGWGLFLIKSMVDKMNVTSGEDHHTVELIMRLDGTAEGGE